MQIILKEDIRHLGNAGEIVSVKDGYARNFLIPRDLAVRADTGNMKRLDHEQRLLVARRERQRRTAQQQADRLDGVVLRFEVQTGEDDKMFGSITSHDVQAKLEELGHEVDRRLLGMEHPFRSVGVYLVPVYLHGDIQTRIRAWVLPAA